jgi:transcriptional regulator with GAF, ATPase, and Fis domain
MRTQAERIQGLAQTLSSLLDQEEQTQLRLISSLIQAVKLVQGETADRRLQPLARELKELQDQLALLGRMAREDYLAKISREAEALTSSQNEDREDETLAALLASLLAARPRSLNQFCDLLLDQLLALLKAERGFVIFYQPETTEADLIAARRFQTTCLTLSEYDFSRTLLGEVFRRGSALLVDDASRDPAYSHELSVRRFELKSVLVAPLCQDGRTAGAIYLENNTQPGAFDCNHLQLAVRAADFAAFYLHHARLLPAWLEASNRVFLDASRAPQEIIGQSPSMLALLDAIGRAANSPATVLIEGESGTGKELVARALHFQSDRRAHPFIAINCAAIPKDLLEAELFGYEKGAFTGAAERQAGQIERADGGTLFLDEVSEMEYPLQAKLLRFLQPTDFAKKEFTRIGGREPQQVDVRIVAATSKDLKSLVEASRFQEALYYRLNVISLRVPALRERKTDIPLLAALLAEKISAGYRRHLQLPDEVLDCLQDYSFPGNVRELENLIHRLAVFAPNDSIRLGDLPPEILQVHRQRLILAKEPLYRILETPPADLAELRRRRKQIQHALAQQERALIETAIREADGNVTEAARRLGINRVTIHKILRKTGSLA